MRLRVLQLIVTSLGVVGGILIGIFAGPSAPPGVKSAKDVKRTQSEVRVIYASKALIHFARKHDIADIESNQQLHGLINAEHLQGTWYAMTIRDYFTDGRYHDETIVERPGELKGTYGRARSVLYTLAGGRECWGTFDPTMVKVVIIPDRVLDQEPAIVLVNLVEVSRTSD